MFSCADCWVPDYCNATNFYYRLCKLRLRGRGKTKDSEYACPEGEYCEELECAHKCWLPPSCWCNTKSDGHGPHYLPGRMFCTTGKCFKHPSTQWGLCRKEPEHHELPDHEHPEDEEPLLPTGFHFWTPDELLVRQPCPSPVLHACRAIPLTDFCGCLPSYPPAAV
jgi:hypothetical protein